ncbi:MAG: hypothetical protein HYS32_04195 [Candidatus Woesearchaeota archaeon]|nr:MAG: hypothetical protein HYS32_04195 [Candidatus Woesearchaeota archaeon]
MEYDLELDKAVAKIKEEKAKMVLLQLPDGLKDKASEIVDYIQSKVDATIFIWLESNWGNCDFPIVDDIDLVIQWGHNNPSELMAKPGGVKWD